MRACGFSHSTFVTVPVNVTGFCESYSAANAWCARRGTAVSVTPSAAAIVSRDRTVIRALLRLSREVRPGLGEGGGENHTLAGRASPNLPERLTRPSPQR